MNEINISKATDLPNEFFDALNTWKKNIFIIMNTCEVKWPAKLVKTVFKYNNKYYKVTIIDIFNKDQLDNTPNNFLEAILELYQAEISNDLSNLGATNIRSFGFLD